MMIVILTMTISHGVLLSVDVNGGCSHVFGAQNNIYLGSVGLAQSQRELYYITANTKYIIYLESTQGLLGLNKNYN